MRSTYCEYILEKILSTSEVGPILALIAPRGYHPPSSQCYYHWVDTSAGGLLVPEDIILPVVSVSITRSIPLLVDY